jgi:hypothetical protein
MGCNCKEPCEDCKHEEKIDLDNISDLLFNEAGLQANAEKKKESKEDKPGKEKLDKDEPVKKEASKNTVNAVYKDPISEEYKLMWNNKIGKNFWTENRIFIF